MKTLTTHSVTPLYLRLYRGACVLCLFAAFGCGENETTAPQTIITQPYLELESSAAVKRVSLALRGLNPSLTELESIQDGKETLETLAAQYTESDAFGETIKDMYAEILLIRAADLIFPREGPLGPISNSDVRNALSEEPLNLIREVVLSDQPFTDILTADWTMLDDVGSQIWADHTYDDALGGLQRVQYTDGRPAAGVLSTNPFLVRHESNGANYNRGRASMVADMFLCEPFGRRDIPITGDVDLSDDEAVANALQSDPQCVACHQVVDPLAQHFWGFRPRLVANQIIRAYADGDCSEASPCYPITMYPLISPRLGERPWERLGLRGPNYWGADTADLADMGAEIATDPRFARCTVEQFVSYFAQTDREDLDADLISKHQAVFVESGYDAKALAQSIVTDPWFLARTKNADFTSTTPEPPGAQVLRPEQLERTIEGLTDFRLVYDLSSRQNIGDIRVMLNDGLGFRAMAGGIDGFSVLEPVHTLTPVRLLVYSAYAEEAAGFVVDEEFQKPLNERKLLNRVAEDDSDEAMVRAQLTHLHALIYSQIVDSSDPSIDDLYELWLTGFESEGANLAWKTVLTAMFQAPQAILY